jgi:hypothetical protein
VLLAWIGLLVATLTSLVGHVKELKRPKIDLKRSRVSVWVRANRFSVILISLAILGAFVSGIGIVGASNATSSLQSRLDKFSRQNDELRRAMQGARSDNAKLRETILIQAARSLTPVEPVSISYQLTYPCDISAFKPYLARLRRNGNALPFIVNRYSPEYPRESDPNEESAYTMLSQPRITLSFSRMSNIRGYRAKTVGLRLTPSPSGLETWLSIQTAAGCDHIEEHVTVNKLLNVTPTSLATILSRVDLVGADLIVSLDPALPLETRLNEVSFRFGDSAGQPLTLLFDDSERHVCCKGVEIEVLPPLKLPKVSYRKMLAADDLGVRVGE